MRQRKVKDLESKLAALGRHLITDPAALRGRWGLMSDGAGEAGDAQETGPARRVFLELGCGKGQFLSGKAQADPAGLYVGVEGNESVILRAVEKAEEMGLQNLRFVASYVNNVLDWFAPGELSAVYMNFSDPWPKKRHLRRRLTYRGRIAGYLEALVPGGTIEFKTDNLDLYEFTLEEIEALGLSPAAVSRDLHASDLDARLSMTEYEEKFSSWGRPIYYVCVRKETLS
jgi:tRNA (guanine-N7-)-methyltransferase